MGIDIRDGSQLECIQCALCIDACNDIMGKIGRPRNLIAYDSIASQEAAAKGQTSGVQVLRARTVLYAGLLGLVGTIMLVAVYLRTTLEVNVLHDRSPAFVLLSDGAIRNAYTVKILNKRHEPREYRLDVIGLANAALSVAGGVDAQKIRVATDALRELRVFVTVSKDVAAALTAHTPLTIAVTDLASGTTSTRATHFQR
jgi:polyferredoxin